MTRGRRAYVEQVEQRAIEAERSRDAEARRSADEERVRIARELHDVLAHRISSISVQSGVALHLLEHDPGQARIALQGINDASREALGELRATLGLLRGVDERSPRAPAAGLARLGEIVAGARAAGVDVEIVAQGAPDDLPSAVDLAAFRIVQESLTNVMRHAPGRQATVTLTFGPEAVTVETVDDGSDVATDWGRAGGHGLVGMRERALALGGEFEAGPRTEGGFRVFVRLPIIRAVP